MEKEQNLSQNKPGSFIWTGFGALAIVLIKLKSALLTIFTENLKLGWRIKGFCTIFLRLWLYVLAFAWKFAVVIILMLFTHESGHWIFMKACNNTQISRKILQLGRALDKNPAMTLLMGAGLSKKVPAGKTASEYYMLGFQYKTEGWTEQARESLTRAIGLDGNEGRVGAKAKTFLGTRLPRYPVPEKAVSMNIEAKEKNSLFTRVKAEEIWKQCIADYPKFEWPYSNLGDLYIQESKFKEAETLLNGALNINPNYINALVHLGECKLKQNDKTAAQDCLDRALKLDPDDFGAKLLGLRIRLYELFQVS